MEEKYKTPVEKNMKDNLITSLIEKLIKITHSKSDEKQQFDKNDVLSKLTEEDISIIQKGGLKNCAISFIHHLDNQRYDGKMCVSNGECEDIENAFLNSDWNTLHKYYNKFIIDNDIIRVPITEEILLHNGFERVDIAGTYIFILEKEKPRNNGARREFYRIKTYLMGENFGGIFEIENCTQKGYDFCKIKCKYVHELQQVLKIYGINKEIDVVF